MAENFVVTIAAGQNLAACCATENQRYVTSNVVIFPGEKGGTPHAIATDGRILAMVVLSGNGPDKPVLIPGEVVKANEKDTVLTVAKDVRCTSGKKTTLVDLPEQSGKFPNPKQIFDGALGDNVTYAAMRLSADYLYALAHAISSDGTVYLLVPLPTNENCPVISPCLVVSGERFEFNAENLSGVGLIVPMAGSTTDTTFRSKLLERVRQFASQLPADGFAFGEAKGSEKTETE